MISTADVTVVFLHENLEFMQTTAEQLRAANPRLVPLVPHDRVTTGGMPVSTGVLLLTALWGCRGREQVAVVDAPSRGGLGYAPAIAVQLAVGYTDGTHLLPAFVELGVFLLGITLSHQYLCKSATKLEQEWSNSRPAAVMPYPPT